MSPFPIRLPTPASLVPNSIAVSPILPPETPATRPPTHPKTAAALPLRSAAQPAPLRPTPKFLQQLPPIPVIQSPTPHDYVLLVASRDLAEGPMVIQPDLCYLALHLHGSLLQGTVIPNTPDILTPDRETAFHGITELNRNADDGLNIPCAGMARIAPESHKLPRSSTPSRMTSSNSGNACAAGKPRRIISPVACRCRYDPCARRSDKGRGRPGGIAS